MRESREGRHQRGARRLDDDAIIVLYCKVKSVYTYSLFGVKGWANKMPDAARSSRSKRRPDCTGSGSLAQCIVAGCEIEGISLLVVLLFTDAVGSADDGVVTLVGLQGELLRGLELLLLQLLDLPGKHSLGGDGGVDAGRLDGDDEVAAGLEEVLGVEGDDARLVGLGDVGEDGIAHADEHAVPDGVAGILDDWDDVGALLRHVDEIAAGAVGELHGVHEALGPDDVGAVGHGGTRGGAEVEELGAGLDVDVVEAAEDAGGNLGAERVPHPVLDLVSLVLDGELHVKTFENGELVDTTIRRVGDYAKKLPGDMHMEQGGPDGALVLFELYAPDGQLTEQLDKKGNTLRTLTTDQLRRFFKKQRAAA